LLEWSFERLVNLDLMRGVRAPQLVQFLEALPETAQSAVLSERLAELYSSLGKPGSAIDTWQRALTLNPSPQQKIRLHQILAEKLLAENRITDAAENLRQFITDSPDYPDLPAIRDQLKFLEEKIAAQTNAPAK
jgi:tetratricopeptide (TPR) repeat protein